jgi:hypothetical protein
MVLSKIVRSLLPLVLSSALGAVTWPIGISANGRFFVDANKVPFLMSFDTNHAVIGTLPASGYPAYLSNRQGYFFNGVVIFGSSLVLSASGAAYDGKLPFTVGTAPASYDFGTNGANLNSAYWSEVAAFVSQAASYGMVVALNPMPGQYYDCNTGGQTCGLNGAASTFASNGPAKVFGLGAAFGSMFKNAPNIIWYLGDDCGNSYGDWCNLSLENEFWQGILSTDPNHIGIFENNFPRSYSNQVNSASFTPKPLNADLVYTYYETYDSSLQAYASAPAVPCFLGEGNYEGGNHTGGLPKPANQLIVRMQDWWTMTSGCSGYMWGNEIVNHDPPNDQSSLNTLATSEVRYLPSLFWRYAWWKLAPAPPGNIVTAGYGAYSANNYNLYQATYATTAWIPDGTLAITYTPSATKLTVDMSRFAGSQVAARWYDPSSATCMAPAGSPFASAGSQTFSTPGNNRDGDPDWVLVLDAAPSGTPAITCLSRNSGYPGSIVTILGTNFGASQGASTVTFKGTAASPASWSATSITVPVPKGATSGTIVVTVNGVSCQIYFKVV